MAQFRLCVILLSLTSLAYGQQKSKQPSVKAKHTATQTWTKRITRLISLADSDINPNGYTYPKNKVQNLAEILTRGAKTGKIKAYESPDSNFSMVLTKRHLNEVCNEANDTVEIEDPVTGDYITRITTTRYNYSQIKLYKILEEWTFSNDKTTSTVKIIGIAPVIASMGSDGDYDGITTLYWLKYSDIKGIVTSYQKLHPKWNLWQAVWNDFFYAHE